MHGEHREHEEMSTGTIPTPPTPPDPATRKGLCLSRRNTQKGTDPLDQVLWEKRDAIIRSAEGSTVFEQRGVWFPRSWSQTATDVVTQKYFRGRLDSPNRESSVRAMILRVADAIHGWGLRYGYFATREDADVHRDELIHLLVRQKFAFNSPVWFNVGVEDRPQCSACFINSVDDSIGSIMDLAKTEVELFRHGSGAGSNLSRIRSSKEHLSGGGRASGPVSFMRGYDAFAGAIKSGGKTRRAAKMVILDVDHPDILEFIRCKMREEAKAAALVDAGYDGNFDAAGGAYDSIQFQNANHSVRVTSDFMRAALEGDSWSLRAVTDAAHVVQRVDARELLREIAHAAWSCGDPGVQFDTTINAAHTCPESGPIRASNPCSEYMFLDDSACNLGSLNLREFQDTQGEIDVSALCHAVRIAIIAMEILVEGSAYPTPAITENSRRFRPLGLGYANLGALLMSRGLPYDSYDGRQLAAAITALIAGTAYETSARIAQEMGPFEAYDRNRDSFLNAIATHRLAADDLATECNELGTPGAWNVAYAAREAWKIAAELGEVFGYRNAQSTVLAPTGTIAFLMDCDTTGVEPDVALVKRKRLVGGGTIDMENGTVPQALITLGYDVDQVGEILAYCREHGTVEGCATLRSDHLPVFDCALPAPDGSRSIHYLGHLRMMAAVQPFLSGAISKTVNMPADCTVEDVASVIQTAWEMKLKSIAVYRDGCKRTQPLSTKRAEEVVVKLRQRPEVVSKLRDQWLDVLKASPDPSPAGPPIAVRRRLDDERQAVVHKFSIGGHEGYVTVGLYEDGSPGEIFVRMAKEGSTIAGLMDSFATAISIALQHGVSLRLFADKFRGTRFEPSGHTGDSRIPIATSIMDYLFRWIEIRFFSATVPTAREAQHAAAATAAAAAEPMPVVPRRPSLAARDTGAPLCPECGSLMERSGSCYRCTNCGATSGCS